MSAYERIRTALETHGSVVKERGAHRLNAQCPAHDDREPSLSVAASEGQALIYCHAGCAPESVMTALGLTMVDLFDNPKGVRYAYPDERIVIRTPAKGFRQQGNTKGSALYRSDEIGDATEVFVTEGEKDADAIRAAGGVAVCPAMGAGKAHLFDWSPLNGRNVTIIADKDGPGYSHAQDVEELLRGKAASVRIVESAVGKDAADHIAAGKGLDDFVALHDNRPRLWKATDLKPATPPRWLAKGRLPRAAISLLVGDEGIGKSLLWVWLAAAVTTGKPLPEFGIPATDPADVIVVVTEDDWSTTVLPRLQVAGADLKRLWVICTEDDGSGAPIFPRDLYLIAEASVSPALVVVDAWLDTVPSGLSVRDPQHARQALHPWRELATGTDAAVLLLTHTNRVASPNARDRYGATGELRKKARMTLFAQADEDGNLVVGPEKSNTAAPIPASVFTIAPIPLFRPTEDSDGTVPLLTYAGESERTAREHIAASVGIDDEEPGGNPAKRFILDFLASTEEGEAAASDVLKEGRKNGFSDQELKDARRRHRNPRIVSRKASYGDGWVWAIEAAIEGGTPSSEGGTDTPEGGEGGIPRDTPPSLPPSLPTQGGKQVALVPDVPPSTNVPPSTATNSRKCVHCGKPTAAGQTDPKGRPAHLSCTAASVTKGAMTA